MELVFTICAVFALLEWREWKAKRQFRAIEAQIKRISRHLHFVGDLSVKFEANQAAVALLAERIAPMGDFILEARTSLDTVVKEYEINGIPMHLQRANVQHFDGIEGI